MSSILARLFAGLTSIVARQEVQQAHHFYRYIHDLLKVYSYIQDLPLNIQAAWLGTIVVLMLMHYDIKVAGETDNPAAIRPLRLFLRRAILVVIGFVVANLFGWQVIIGAALVYLVLMRYYFLSASLLIVSTLACTLSVLEF